MIAINTLQEYLRIVVGDYLKHTQYDSNNQKQLSLRKMEEWIQQYYDIPLKEISKKHNAEVDAYVESISDKLYDFAFEKYAQDPKETSNSSSRTLFYRGVKNNGYPIAAGIYRGNEKHEESYYFNEIQVRCPEIFSHISNLEKLTYMQHYGCPTRLLDITTNPLVALYFACSGDDSLTGSVYVFSVPSEEVLYSGSDRIQMLAHLPAFQKAEQQNLRTLSYQYLIRGDFRHKKNGEYEEKVVERFFHSVKHELPEFERVINPYHLIVPQFVQPLKDNPRILKQDGAFIISGLDKDQTDSDRKIRKFVCEEITISGNCKKAIMKQLEIVGIHQASLFPEVEMVADYLKHR